MEIGCYFEKGRLEKVIINGKTISNLEYLQMYDANYWKFEYDGKTYRFGLNRVLLIGNEIYVPENIDESEHIDGKWTETIQYKKVGEILGFPVVWRMIRDHRLGDLVEYGVKLTINGKEIFDDLGRSWKERYARVLKIVHCT